MGDPTSKPDRGTLDAALSMLNEADRLLGGVEERLNVHWSHSSEQAASEASAASAAVGAVVGVLGYAVRRGGDAEDPSSW